jgi:hypothetical protein
VAKSGLPNNPSHDDILAWLLGAPVQRRVSWNGVEIAVPRGAECVWRRFAVRGLPHLSLHALIAMHGSGTPETVPWRNGQATANRLDLDLEWQELGFDDVVPEGFTAKIFFPVEPPKIGKLPNAKLSYTELYDLRRIFHRIDAAEDVSGPPWRTEVRRTLDKLRDLSENEELMTKGLSDLKTGWRTPEAELALAAGSLWAHADLLVAPPVSASEPAGFGSVRLKKVASPRGGRPPILREFVNACEVVGVTSPLAIAAIASLEIGRNRLAHVPSLLKKRDEAQKFWMKARSEFKRRTRRSS